MESSGHALEVPTIGSVEGVQCFEHGRSVLVVTSGDNREGADANNVSAAGNDLHSEFHRPIVAWS